MLDLVGLFEDLVNRDDESICTPAAAFAIARVAYPSLSVDLQLARLNALSAQAAQQVASGGSPAARVTRLSRHLFTELGFRGNREDYYDPRNSFLNDVVERRLGIPITLSLVYVEVAAACGMATEGLGFPGHFLVRDVETGWILDPFNAGQRREVTDCRDLFLEQGRRREEWTEDLLIAVTKRQLLLRMVNNLRRYYSGVGDRERLALLDAMAAVVSDDDELGPLAMLQ
jgi:regulator of sirC expression with transglutaminase-like and TPR domain